MPSSVTITAMRADYVAGTVEAWGRFYSFERNAGLLTLKRCSTHAAGRMVAMASRHAGPWRDLVEEALRRQAPAA